MADPPLELHWLPDPGFEIGTPEDFLKVGPPGGATFASYFFNFFSNVQAGRKVTFFNFFAKAHNFLKLFSTCRASLQVIFLQLSGPGAAPPEKLLFQLFLTFGQLSASPKSYFFNLFQLSGAFRKLQFQHFPTFRASEE